MKNILCDIDHTISNAFWRDAMIGSSSWDDYHKASIDDTPLHDISRMIKTLHNSLNYRIIGMTARPARFRQLTVKWLLRHEIPMDELLMRPDDDFRPATEIKMALAKDRFPNLKFEVDFVLEDREDVCIMFKGIGLTVLQVHGRAK